ncbi:peptidoglycan-binding domain-containing protein [Asanoa sp. WMMD1127]|uniref:peptidoglycan-binding domain-containing protein n=1 Tax=Asanoa sp. WMMD1127 TaxID=3016107 RepID=UPI0024171333|nr:peptidoglycan-binding domain-containing protein [Asanoa sp. WMMD1127]MDG4827287.1 peptidoglycan-binding domain-containing protein [Asanoa sp. WMMD1127]
MSFLERRRTLVAAAGVLVLLVAGLTTPSPAHASAAQGVISGAGAVTDDFGDEATLSRTGPYRNSTAVALWQTILAAEGFIDNSGIDCRFGPGTEAGTRSFQRRYGLSADGIVGPNTWSKADNYLRLQGTTVGYEDIVWTRPTRCRSCRSAGSATATTRRSCGPAAGCGRPPTTPGCPSTAEGIAARIDPS